MRGQWHDVLSAREEWVDAPDDDSILGELLSIAAEQVMAYAPASLREEFEGEVGDDEWPEGWSNPPIAFRRAQLMHAKNMWTADRVDSGGTFGDGEFQVRPHPLDWHVKQLIRPRTAVPRVR